VACISPYPILYLVHPLIFVFIEGTFIAIGIILIYYAVVFTKLISWKFLIRFVLGLISFRIAMYLIDISSNI